MKPVIIIIIVLVLLIPIPIFAQEFGGQSGERLDSIETELDNLKANSIWLLFGLYIELIGILLIAVYWGTIVPLEVYTKWIENNLKFFVSVEPRRLKDREHISWFYIRKGEKISDDVSTQTLLYEMVPKEFRTYWNLRRKIPILCVVIIGASLQLITTFLIVF